MRAGQLQSLRSVQRLLDLAENLSVARVERVEARGHTEEVFGRAVFLVGVQGLGRRACRGLRAACGLLAGSEEAVDALAILGNWGAPSA